MKALSIQQPWAWLIVNGYKDIENRTWSTSFRGPFLVHAGLKFDREGYELVRAHFPDIPMPHPSSMERGGIVGEATLTACVRDSSSRWYSGPNGFVLADRRPLPFKACPGKLGFFTPEPRTVSR